MLKTLVTPLPELIFTPKCATTYLHSSLNSKNFPEVIPSHPIKKWKGMGREKIGRGMEKGRYPSQNLSPQLSDTK